MSEATSVVFAFTILPGYRYAHPGYACFDAPRYDELGQKPYDLAK
jgi:hypothetical protein